MIASEAYDKFLIKSEQNSTNDGLSTDKGRFALLYNEYQNRFMEYVYERKNNDFIRYIQNVLVEKHFLTSHVCNNNYCLFKLPDNYFNISTVSGKASKGFCKNTDISLFEIKDFNRTQFLIDEFTKPSFEYRESLYIISDNYIKVFIDDFSIDSLSLSYYRYPKKIKLLNPDNPESDFDDSYDLDFDDKVIDRIITYAVSGFEINIGNDKWQLHNLSSKEV